jgi:transposase
MTSPDRDARARKVARLYASGLSVREAAKRTGIHHQTALDDLRRLDDGFGYGPGPWRRRLDKRHEAARGKRMTAAVQLRTQGLSLRQIAGQLGVSYQTVANDLKQWGATHPNVISLAPEAVKKWRVKTAPTGAKRDATS